MLGNNKGSIICITPHEDLAKNNKSSKGDRLKVNRNRPKRIDWEMVEKVQVLESIDRKNKMKGRKILAHS